MPTINTNGVTLTYEAQGNPAHPALLLIMGVGMQLTGWPDSFCRLLVERGFYVIRFDNRDIGLSTSFREFGTPNLKTAAMKYLLRMKIKPFYTLEDMARDTVGLMDGLGIKSAHLVGASMGGMIAQIVAAEHSDRVLTLTSIMSTSGRRGLPGPTREVAKSLMASPDPSDPKAMLNLVVDSQQLIGSPGYPMSREEVTERVARNLKRSVSPDGYARQMLAIMASGDRTAQLKSILAPTLVIHGSADPLIPVECGRDTARLIPGASLREIEGMGHNFPPALDERLTGMIAHHCKIHTTPEMGNTVVSALA